jgi:Cytochrome P460
MTPNRFTPNAAPSRAALAAAVAAVLLTGIAQAQSTPAWGPKWTTDGGLELPKGYHEWVFLGAPITPNGLNGGKAAFQEYHNVYVHPEAIRAYRNTGAWPDGTIMLKELRLSQPGTNPDGSSVESSGRGYFPAARNGIDISVKDSRRFKDTNGWGFFNFGHHAPPYEKTATAAPKEVCAGCHIANATNMVFSKFYEPILKAE